MAQVAVRGAMVAAPVVVDEVGPVLAREAPIIAEQVVTKGAMLKKAGEAILVGGILPGAGFTIASNELSKPSSSANPEVKNKDLIKAHSKAKGNQKKLNNMKIKGKKFSDIQKKYIETHKSKLHKAYNNKKLLYNKNGEPTQFHKQAILHNISLHPKK